VRFTKKRILRAIVGTWVKLVALQNCLLTVSTAWPATQVKGSPVSFLHIMTADIGKFVEGNPSHMTFPGRSLWQTNPSTSRICFIHVGTHKTGTTYLQDFLQSTADILAGDGLYIPRSGRIGGLSGHHNIAWQLNRDVRFESLNGGLAELIEELVSVQAPRVCLSSEDFEFLYKDQSALRYLRSELRRINYTVKIIVFIRPQADYAESMYGELVKHGVNLDFIEFLQRFTSGGEFDCGRGCFLTSDYNLLLDSFSSVFGIENIIVRPYRNSSAPGRILFDFLSQIIPDFHSDSGKYPVPSSRRHVSPSFRESFHAFIRNNFGEPWKTIQIDRASWVEWIEQNSNYELLSGPFDPIDLTDVATKFWKLAIANLNLLRKYGVFVPFVSARALRKDLRAMCGLDRNSTRRKLLIKVFRQRSHRLKPIMLPSG
jgi:hypothetical protein